MEIYKYIEMHVEKYLFEIIKVYKKQSITLCKICKKMYVEKYVRFSCFNLYLETSGLHYFLN